MRLLILPLDAWAKELRPSAAVMIQRLVESGGGTAEVTGQIAQGCNAKLDCVMNNQSTQQGQVTSSPFGMFACTAAALSMSLALSACDKVTSAQVGMDAGFPVGVECVQQAEQHLGAVERFDRLPKQASVNSEQFTVSCGNSVVGVTLGGGAAETVSVSFAWMCIASVEEEWGALRLLDDVQSAVVRACELEEPQTKITRRCGGRMCEKWLAGK